MMVNMLEKLFEHNNWANLGIIQFCSVLNDVQLDAAPQSATKGSIRQTLRHLIAAQQRYLAYLSGTETEGSLPETPTFDELRAAAFSCGEGLLAVARGEPDRYMGARIQTRSGSTVEAWVIVAQILNHAGEHREQICSMLTALGLTPPDLDGWSYGEATGALVPVTS
jgi:uncharacterized damage-inducible protein DinB